MKNNRQFTNQLSLGNFAMTLLMLNLVVPQTEAVHPKKMRSTKTKAVINQASIPQGISAGQDYFKPDLRLTGIGLDRQSMNDEELAVRNQAIINTQTFNILRNRDRAHQLDAQLWAENLTEPKLQRIISDAASKYGFPKGLLEGVIYIESGGNPDAHSPTGPQGIMQVTTGTGVRMGLVQHIKSWVVKTFTSLGHKASKSKPAVPPQTETKRVQITTTVDMRRDPELAIPAAAKFLAQMTANYQQYYKLSPEAAQQMAVWAYHSGEGVPNRALVAAKKYDIKQPNMVKLMLLNSPAYNPDLFALIQKDMDKDYGPTYWFRVLRAEQLLDLYRQDKDHHSFITLMDKYKSTVPDSVKAGSRFEVWYPMEDLLQTTSDLQLAFKNGKLITPPNNPKYFSYVLRTEGPQGIGQMDEANRSLYETDPPPVVGTMEYVAYEVRRGWEQSHPKGEKFIPLELTSMVRSVHYQDLLHGPNPNSRTNFPSHAIGAVDISLAKLPAGEKMWLLFVVQDMGFDEYLGYFHEHEAQQTLHIAPNPNYAVFFKNISDKAFDAYKKHPAKS